ncbi:MAG: hypothetical protein AAF757_32445 [Cyanobacteria bacterium P01_D01_bin.116]
MLNFSAIVIAVMLMYSNIANASKGELMRQKMYTIPKICKTGDDGLIIVYLKSDKVVPNLGLVESILETLRMVWLPFGLRYSRASSERVRDAAIWSIARLEGQIALIRDKFDIVPQMLHPYPYQTNVSVPLQSTTKDRGEKLASQEIDENLDIDLGDDFDFTQNLLTQLS